MSHDHVHEHEHDPYLEANRAHFDQDVHKYDDRPMALKLAKTVGEFVTDKYDFNEDETILLDYACGTGLVSQALAPYCQKIVGVDISSGMVDWYNTRVTNQGIDPEEMKAVCVELKGAATPDELEGIKFDVAICSMAYHHFRSIEDVTKILAFHLKPGGRLMVVDIIFDPSRKEFYSGRKADAHDHSHHHDHGHDHGDAHGHSHEHQHEHQSPRHKHDQTAPADSTVDIGDENIESPTAATPKQTSNSLNADNSEAKDNLADTDLSSFPIPPPNVVAHKGGFTRERIEGVFNDAGLLDFDWNVVGDFETLHGKGIVQLFCAIGTTSAPVSSV